MSRSFYHLSRLERETILEGIVAGTTLKDIAASIGKDPTSVSREVKKYRSYEGLRRPHTNARCIRFEKCDYHNLCSERCTKKRCATCASHACKEHCTRYEQKKCARIMRWPYVCNGCDPAKQRRCMLVRYKYHPCIADAKATKEKSRSRCGISLSGTELVELDRLITPLIKVNKMSVEAAVKACAEEGEHLPVSAPTIRRYIENGDSGVIRLDLLSASLRKPRRKKVARVTHHADDGRSFADFEKLSKKKRSQAWEIDTVQGAKSDTCRLLTLCHRATNFLLIFKIERATSECVVGILDYLDDLLSEIEKTFEGVFSVLLTDNGAEFSDAQGIERSGGEKTARCSLYYCDPYSGWQKPHVEATHTFIRRVLPKGVSFESLTHSQVAMLCSHINSYPRASSESTPFRQILEVLPARTLIGLGIMPVGARDVMLSPVLLDSTR
jgi:IS30 family transposase